MSKYIDLIGKKINFLTVIQETRIEKSNRFNCLCKCVCGNEKWINKKHLLSNKPISCGCKLRKNIVGKKFNKLTILSLDHKESSKVYPNHYKYFYKCKCDCGKYCVINGSSITNNHTKSCGCLFSDKRGLVDSAIKVLYNRYKASAKIRNLEFNISFDQLKVITSQNCFYCDSIPSKVIKNYAIKEDVSYYTYNGIDRIDNSKGYIIENCVPCCYKCNLMKQDFLKEEFINHIDLIYKHTHSI